MTGYTVQYEINGVVEVSLDLSTLKFFRMPYKMLSGKYTSKVDNYRFVVYLLSGYN